VISNTALYAVEVAIARSPRFYARYEDGMNMPLIQACEYLSSLPDRPKPGEVAVSPRYTNLNKTKASPFGIRATVWLTGRDDIESPRWRDTVFPPNSSTAAGKSLRRWLKARGIKWYLYQPDINPWRVWHFRLGWYQKMQTGQTAEKDTGGWTLYRIAGPGAGPRNNTAAAATAPQGAAPAGGAKEDDWIPVRLPNRFQPVTRVPGL
jgi:hypothetical protein